MHPNPIRDVSEGADTLFDVGDMCGSHRKVPRREPWLGEVLVVSDGMGAIGPVSDMSRGMPRHVGMSSCMQDACGGHGDALQGGGSLSCPGNSSVAPTASGHAIEAARVAPDAWQCVLHVGDVGGGGGDEDGGDAMGAVRVHPHLHPARPTGPYRPLSYSLPGLSYVLFP